MGISMKVVRPLVILFPLAVLLSGCVKRLPEVSPTDIPRLEQEMAADPADTDVKTQLGMAYYLDDRFAQSRDLLTEVVEAGAATGAAYLYLGLANEATEDWGAAREAYTGYIQAGRYGPLKEEIERRLALIVRNELRAQAQDAIAREDELSQEPPEPRSVAVFPFRLVSESEDLMPLQVAMADMMITDLGLSGGLVVLERTQIQSLLDEMALTEAGYVSEETGSRAGRMLRSEHVVQGAMTTLPEQALRFDTDVVNTERRASVGATTGEDQLEAIFDLEKETVFQILDVLGVEITPAEREAINNNRAENILAFLAYGRGLMALDEGNYAAAQGFFNEAIQIDPGFDMAQDMEVESEALGEAAETTTSDVASRATGETSAGTVSVATTGTEVTTTQTSTILQSTTEAVNPSPVVNVVSLGQPESGTDKQAGTRDPTQEAQGQEGVTKPATATIRITIRKPGGGQ